MVMRVVLGGRGRTAAEAAVARDAHDITVCVGAKAMGCLRGLDARVSGLVFGKRRRRRRPATMSPGAPLSARLSFAIIRRLGDGRPDGRRIAGRWLAIEELLFHAKQERVRLVAEGEWETA